MKKNIVTIIITFIILINIIIASFFIFTLNSIEIPKINASIEILDITENDILIKTKINMINTNFFTFIIDDLSINIKTTNWKDLGTIHLNGGIIESNENKTFLSESTFKLKDYDFSPITADIKGSIGIEILGLFKKNMPILIQVTASIDKIIKNINPPEIIISTHLVEVNDKGVILAGNISINNKNNFKIYVKNSSGIISNDEGSELGKIIIPNTYIHSNEMKKIPLYANLSYEALGSNKIILSLQSKVGASLGGLNKSINVSAIAEMDVPDIKQFLFLNEIMDISISVDFNIRLNGVETIVGLKIYNPTEIPFKAINLLCSISGSTDNKSILIAEGPMNSCDLSSHKESCVKTNLIMKYMDILKSGGNKLFPDWYVITIVGDFSIKNTNQTIPISINAYIDPNPFI